MGDTAIEERKIARTLTLQASQLVSALQGILFAIDDITGDDRGLAIAHVHIERLRREIDTLGNDLCPWEEA